MPEDSAVSTPYQTSPKLAPAEAKKSSFLSDRAASTEIDGSGYRAALLFLRAR